MVAQPRLFHSCVSAEMRSLEKQCRAYRKIKIISQDMVSAYRFSEKFHWRFGIGHIDAAAAFIKET